MLEQYNKVLVTGGLGFIGTHLVNELLSLEKDVVIVDNHDTALHRSVPPGATLIEADIRHPRFPGSPDRSRRIDSQLTPRFSGSRAESS